MKNTLFFLGLLITLISCNSSSNKSSNNNSSGEYVKKEIWEIGNIVNDFDEPTGEYFVYADFFGVFCNSATAGDKLRIRLIARRLTSIEYDYSIYLEFDEYNNGTYDNDDYDDVPISVKIINKENRSIFKGRNFYDLQDKEGKRVYLETILIEDGVYTFEVKFKYKTIYKFHIDTKGLNQALIKAKLKK